MNVPPAPRVHAAVPTSVLASTFRTFPTTLMSTAGKPLSKKPPLRARWISGIDVTVIVGLILLLVAAIVATAGLTDVGGTYASFAVFGDQFTGPALCSSAGLSSARRCCWGWSCYRPTPSAPLRAGRPRRWAYPSRPDTTSLTGPTLQPYQGRIACAGLLFEKGRRYEGDRCQ
jgi:hypothetical protein